MAMEVKSGKRQERSAPERIALASLVVATGLALAKLLVGIVTGSLSVLSEGLHSTLDAGVTALTFFAVRLAAKPPDHEHPYGHGRAENLAALAQATLLVLLGGGVAFEALVHLANGTIIHPPWYAFALMVVSIGVDYGRSRALRRAARRYDSQALAADAANFTADLFGSAAVLAGLLVARAGWTAADPVAALVVVLLVWFIGTRVGISAVQVLMDSSPKGVDDRLRSAVGAVEGVVGVEGVRARKSGATTLADVTISVGRTSSVERSHEIASEIAKAVATAVPGAATVVHVEPSEKGEDVVARCFAAANRVGLADQVHNVFAIEHSEGLWLTMHAKVPANTPLYKAHEITDELERELRSEIRGLARVEIHLEPRERQQVPGRVVSSKWPDIVTETVALAERYRPILHCHEVAVSEVAGGLHLILHCDAAPDEPISAIHAASLGIESEVHRLWPEVLSVTVHFEPARAGPAP